MQEEPRIVADSIVRSFGDVRALDGQPLDAITIAPRRRRVVRNTNLIASHHSTFPAPPHQGQPSRSSYRGVRLRRSPYVRPFDPAPVRSSTSGRHRVVARSIARGRSVRATSKSAQHKRFRRLRTHLRSESLCCLDFSRYRRIVLASCLLVCPRIVRGGNRFGWFWCYESGGECSIESVSEALSIGLVQMPVSVTWAE
jgi:hypothetical protein